MPKSCTKLSGIRSEIDLTRERYCIHIIIARRETDVPFLRGCVHEEIMLALALKRR